MDTHLICYYSWASYCCVIQFALNCRKRAFNPCDISSIIWLTPIDGNINDKTFFTSKHSMLWKLRIHWYVLNWRCSADLWRLTEIRERRKIMNDWGYYTSELTITVCSPKPIVYNTHARSFLFCRICMYYAYGVVGAHTLLCVLSVPSLTPSLIKAENAAEEWGRLSEHLHLKTKTSWVSSSGDMSDLLNGGSTTGTRLKINTSGTQDSRLA